MAALQKMVLARSTECKEWSGRHLHAQLMPPICRDHHVEYHALQVTKEEYSQHGSLALGQKVVQELKSQGKAPYLIPVGAHG